MGYEVEKQLQVTFAVLLLFGIPIFRKLSNLPGEQIFHEQIRGVTSVCGRKAET